MIKWFCLGAFLCLLPLPAASAQPADGCAPAKGLSFICGLNEPEDLIQIPGSKWIVASGMGEGGGINLIDSDARTARRFYTGAAAELRADRRRYPDCPAPPDITPFNAHGLALIPTGEAGTYTLYSVTHLPYESIQVFVLDARGAAPAIAWMGCVKLPADFKTNAVTALRDGTILADVQMHNGLTQTDFVNGVKTGGVYEWKPGDKAAHLLPGTELEGNNGIEISPDEREFYVAVSGTQTVAIYDLADTAKPVRTIRTPWFNLDNIHWSGDRLIAAGMVVDEPACGGTRTEILARHGNVNCHRGWVAAQLDPVAMRWHVLAYGEPNPAFGGIATALVVGKTLWLSSFQADRAAYLLLPGPQ